MPVELAGGVHPTPFAPSSACTPDDTATGDDHVGEQRDRHDHADLELAAIALVEYDVTDAPVTRYKLSRTSGRFHRERPVRDEGVAAHKFFGGTEGVPAATSSVERRICVRCCTAGWHERDCSLGHPRHGVGGPLWPLR